jgi:hypothetical protein
MILKPAAKAAGLVCSKADDIFDMGAILEKIAKSIKKSSLIIADLSGRNPNVFYELGLAHSFEKKVILITQSEEDIPSDLKAFEYYKYDINSSAGITQFKGKMTTLFTDFVDKSKSPRKWDEILDIQASAGNEKPIDAAFLKNPEGSCCLWVKTTEEMIHSEANQYFIAHAGNSGNRKEITLEGDNQQDNSQPGSVKRYVDLFYIRTMPSKEENSFCKFQFTCSDSIGLPISITTTEKLESGWHLFTVTWSKVLNAIKFYVDNNCIGTKPFQNWPENIERHCQIGTWPSRAKGHYVNTQIGKINIYSSSIDYDTIVTLLSTKPA